MASISVKSVKCKLEKKDSNFLDDKPDLLDDDELMPRRTLKDVVGDDGSQAENRKRQVIESALAEKLGELLKKSGKRIEKKDSKRTKYVKRP